MAANNQLDVYKIILKKKKGFNFKTLITSRYVQDQETNYRNSGLFNLLKRYGDIQKVKLVLLYLRKEGKRRIKY